MCGIAGFIRKNSDSTECSVILGRMLERIAHRGPDDWGIWIDESVALGHRRLSILELSPAGHQPMLSACGRYVIIFNGEIYNHQQLRQLLEKQDAMPKGGWRGHSDTETLLAAIALWGIVKTLTQLVGMFAFAVWDSLERRLTLARDRLGEKPLYYGWQNGVFLFGSELKALCVHPDFSIEINWDVAATYLRTNYVPTPYSIYKDIYKLPAGTWLQLDAEQIAQKTQPIAQTYWSLAEVARYGTQNPFRGTLKDATNELELLLTNAVQLQAIADVPVGAFLSGGIDSSTIVALMQASTSSKVTTFSIGMPDAKMDESKHAAAVAQHLGTNHIEHIISPKEALEIIPKLPTLWDEPFADSSAIPTYLVSQLARQHVTVALSGDGGDEFFLGYSQYALFSRLWQTRILGKLPWSSLFAISDSLIAADSKKIRQARSVVGAWQQPSMQALNRHWMDRYRGIDAPVFSVGEAGQLPLLTFDNTVTTAGLWDAATYLSDDILTKVDRAAMAVSLETRAPLLDHRVIEFALRIPESFKLKNGVSKRILRDVLYRHVPRQLVDRPKQGFSIPLGFWLKNELRPWVEANIDKINQDNNPWNKEMINRLWSEHISGKRDRTEHLWGIVMLATFIENCKKL